MAILGFGVTSSWHTHVYTPMYRGMLTCILTTCALGARCVLKYPHCTQWALWYLPSMGRASKFWDHLHKLTMHGTCF